MPTIGGRLGYLRSVTHVLKSHVFDTLGKYSSRIGWPIQVSLVYRKPTDSTTV